MKHTLISMAFLFSFSVLFAQDKTAVDHINDGNGFYKQKKYTEALQSYEEAIVLLGDDRPAGYDGMVFTAGVSAYKVKEYQKASDHFQTAIDLEYSKSDDAFKYMAYSYYKMDDMDNYAATLDKAINKFPTDNVDFKNMYGKYLYNKGGNAQKDASTQFAADSDADAYKANLEVAANDLDAAVNYLKDVSAADPADTETTELIKNLYSALKSIYSDLEMADKVSEMQTNLDSFNK